MSDTAQRNPGGASQRIADALLRSVSGASAYLHIAGANIESTQLELGIVETTLSTVELSPAVMRKLRPDGQSGQELRWELLVSATSVTQQLGTPDLACARALFSMALTVTVAGQEYLIESVASNEAFGQTYLFRLLLREARPQSI